MVREHLLNEFFNTFKFDIFWPSIWSILVNIKYIHAVDKCSAALGGMADNIQLSWIRW
jgi:hypothetical protein